MLSKIKQVKRNLFLRAFVFLCWFFLFFVNFVNYIQQEHKVSVWSIVFVVDISNSMNVKDVFYGPNQTTRLELVKHIIEDNVKNLNNKFWLVVFSDKMDYLIPPTLDKDTYITYLRTINTNLLNGGKTNFKNSIQELKKVLNPMDIVVIFSDYDLVWYQDNFKKIQTENVRKSRDDNWYKLNNLTYFVGVWSKNWWIVKNKDWKTMFENWEPLYSKLNIDILKKLTNENNANYLVINDWKKWKILPFLKNFKPANTSYKNKKINYSLILGFLLILLAL